MTKTSWTMDNIFNINNINKEDILIKSDNFNNKYCFIIIDTETCNGFDRTNNAIIQLSFMFLGTDYIYDSYAKPDISIPWMLKNKYYKSNITKNTVKNSPELKIVLLSFLNIISNINNIEPIFIAHNSSFDKTILELCFKFYDMKYENNKWCNTMIKDIFNIRDENGKFIKSLKGISREILDKEYDNIILHNSKNDVFILHKCLLKTYNSDDKISSIILKITTNKDIKKKYEIDINNKIFIKDFKDILKNVDEFCFHKNRKTNISNLIDEYYNIINEEEKILKRKNKIENEFKIYLKNDNYIIINNKKIIFKEITFKDFIEENIIKKEYKKLCIIDINIK
jgi:DNA polymerase III epsilon subunit-like protein